MGERTAPASAIPISFPATVLRSPVRIIRAPRGSPASHAKFVPGPLLVVGHTVRWLPRRHYAVRILRIGLLLRSRLFRVGVFHRAEMAVFPGSLTEGGSGPGTHNKKANGEQRRVLYFCKTSHARAQQTKCESTRNLSQSPSTFPVPPSTVCPRRRTFSVCVSHARARADAGRSLCLRASFLGRSGSAQDEDAR